MKRCPQCNRVESDDALVYCRADGTALISDSGSFSGDAGTAKFGSGAVSTEIETSILPHTTDAAIRRGTAPTTVLPVAPASGSTRELTKPSIRKAWIVMAAAIVVVTVIVGYFIVGKFIAGKRERAIESVAVLPFENKSGNADSEYLSEGLAESLIYRLSQLSNLKVTPRSSAFRYKGKDVDAEKIGNELGVDAVMSGRLILRGDDLTISVDLIDVRNKKTIWGEQFERKMSDLLATQHDIAATITDKLQLRLSGSDSKGISKQYTTNNEAYQLYLQGRYFWNKRSSDNLKKATELLKAATEKDPNFALAYAGLAVIINNVAENYIDRGDLNSATRECQRMIDLDPNFWAAHQTLGIVLVKQGRYDEALAEAQKSTQLANRSNASLALLGHVYARLGRRSETDAIIKELEKRYAAKAADGRDLAVVYAGFDDKDKTFAWLEKAFADHSVMLAFLKLEPLLEPLQSDPRWKNLERRVGVSQ